MIKTIHIKLLLLFSLSILFGHSAFAQSAPTPPVEQHVCVGVSVDYYFYGFPGSTVHWDFNEPVTYTPSGDVILNNASNNITFDGVLYQKGIFPHVYATQGDYLLSIVEQTLSCSSNEITLPVHVHAKPVISDVVPTDIVCSGDIGSIAVNVTAVVPGPLQLQYRLVTSLDVEVVAWVNDNNLSHYFNNLLAGSYKAQIRYVLDSDNSKVVKGSFSESSVVVINSGDTIDPTVSASTDVITTTSADGLGDCDVDIAIVDAIYDDNCSSTLTWAMTGAVTASGSGQVGTYTFSIGITTITYANTDGTNSVTDVMTVTVTDTELPTITCLSDIAQAADASSCDAVVTYVAPVGVDNCSGATTAQIAGLASGSTFPIGVTTNTFEVTDAAGNKASCSFDVTVTKDNNIAVVDVTGTTTPETDPGIVNGIHCPDLNGIQAVVAPSGNTYSAGTSQVQFRVDRLCNTGDWSFAYSIEGEDVNVSNVLISNVGTSTNSSGVVNVSAGTNYVLFTIDVDNVVNTALSIDFKISDGGTESAIKDHITIQHNLKIIPLIGGFE
ncbi:HYR domain-containing protein [Ancylomarina euxinus]|uniref:HYR domain-containing protein n=2 Tax=Ancylomarina euxinus TaxID=2283627 RepID=UPI0018CF4CEB|nr:HYR domain-containing protein [Ancylomarina euxinus]